MLILRHLIKLHKLEIQTRELKVRLPKVSLTGESSGELQFGALIKYINDMMNLGTGASVSHL